MYTFERFLLVAAALAVAEVNAFSALNFVEHMKTNVLPTPVTTLDMPVGGRHFQLEELEDAETSTTDVLLNIDATVTLGGTNGPLYKDAHGTWTESCQLDYNDQHLPVEQCDGDNFKRFFEMKLTRTFHTGFEERDTTKIGEFDYSVERTYAGECFLVGGRIFAMSGEILDVDEIFGQRRVGFFNMIDTTEERENNFM